MSRKSAYFSTVGVVFSLLLVVTVYSLPLEVLEAEILQRLDEWTNSPETTTGNPGWGSSGDTAAFGQTMIVEGMAGSDTQSNPSVFEAISADDGTMDMSVTNYQLADAQFQTNSFAPGGGLASVGDASAVVDGAYSSLNQGATYNSSFSFTGVVSGGIVSNPQTSAGLSAGSLVISSSGQAANGTNVNNNNGWGWTAQGDEWEENGVGWRDTVTDLPLAPADSVTDLPDVSASVTDLPLTAKETHGSGWGWSATQEGATASATSIESIQNLSQQSTASDNITAIAYGNGVDPLAMNASFSAPIAVEGGANGNGVVASADNATAGTAWQNVDFYSYPENNSTMSVSNAEAIAVSTVPTSNTIFSFDNIIVSDFATATNGNNLANNNGGWGQPSQGWGIPAKS